MQFKIQKTKLNSTRVYIFLIYRKVDKFIAIEGFRTAFPENEHLADKIHKFIKS